MSNHFGHNSPGYKAYINSPQWRLKRKEAFSIHGTHCHKCEKQGTVGNLDIHHKTYENFRYEDAATQLVPLCRSCHTVLHEKWKKAPKYLKSKGLRYFTDTFLKDKSGPTKLRIPLSFGTAYLRSFKYTLPAMIALGIIFLLLGSAIPEIFYVMYASSVAISLMAFVGVKEAGTFKERIAGWAGAGVIPTTVFITTAIAQSLA